MFIPERLRDEALKVLMDFVWLIRRGLVPVKFLEMEPRRMVLGQRPPDACAGSSVWFTAIHELSPFQ
jgi:hypothetical protein